ncbi:MAG: hypothetical protein KGQ46_07180 [Hyphomicrobiales bacterium]|nr:hypothetical protein [Hyphomicrobiales bacterium]MDE2114011.1 hypothetical protein [Hyphomicrobiales bacterium]
MSFVAIDPAIIRQTGDVSRAGRHEVAGTNDARQLQQSLLHLLGVAAVAEALGLRLEDANDDPRLENEFSIPAGHGRAPYIKVRAA